MRSPRRQRSRFRSSIDGRTRRGGALALACAIGLGAAGCSDDAPAGDGGPDSAGCGPPAGADAITVGADTDPVGPFHYGGFASSANNDCPAGGDAPVSLTVEGQQTGTGPATFALCLPRPDQLGDGPVPLSDTTRVQVVSVYAKDEAGCTLALDPDVPPTGTLEVLGYCADGLDPAGYGLRLEGTIALRGSCGPAADAGAEQSFTLALSGTAAVVAE